MTNLQLKRFNDASEKYEAGEQREALKELEGLIGELTEPEDRAGPLYHKTIWLLDQGDLGAARNAMEEMKTAVAALGDPPPDTDQVTEIVSLNVMVLDAEAEVLVEEGKGRAALPLIQTMHGRYPKYLLLPEFTEVFQRSRGREGFILTGADRWKEAIPLLEGTPFPDGLSGEAADNLAYCYYKAGNYVGAREQALKALSAAGAPRRIAATHYTLALSEYHLGNMRAAKEHLELCAKIATPEYLGKTQVWQALEATSRALGLTAEADEYHKRWQTPSGKAS